MSSEEVVFQLSRIGPAATCPKVPDVMRLSLGVTKIGRGQHNDFYLDSAVLKNFISRSHVEITGKRNENGEIEFILTDKGLNGTFINDIRTHKNCTLEIGDKITFGHTNGYKIQPGSYAEQPHSEFQFEFQRLSRSGKTSEMYSDSQSSPAAPCEDSMESIPDLKQDVTLQSERLFSDIPTNSVSSSTVKSQKGRARKDSEDSLSDNDRGTSSSSRSSNIKNFRNKSSRNIDNSERSPPPRESSFESRRRTTYMDKQKKEDSEEEEEEEDSDKKEEESEEEIEEPEPKRKPGRKPKNTRPPKKNVKRKVQDSESEDSLEEGPSYMSDDEGSKPEADQRPKPKPVKKKKTSQGNDAPAIGGRKKRRRGGGVGGGGPSSTQQSSRPADLEPGVEWYEDDTCNSAECKRPKKKRTPWVQCDDCDGWYHTVCVGANYNKLKDSDEHFNCGCI